MNGNNDFNTQSRGEGDGYADGQVQMAPKPKTLGWSVASMVVGILSVVCCCFGYTGIIFGIGAIIFSIVARKTLGYFEGMSIAGLVLGIFGLVFGAAIVWNTIFNSEFIDYMNKYYEEFYNSGEI